MPKQHPTILEEDKRLAGAIEKYPCLYNRALEEFTDLNCVNNAWEQISSELDMEVETLKKQFQVLKKRYSRKRHDTRRAAMNASSSFTQEPLENDTYRRALENLQEYSFLKWLDPHIRYKTVKEASNSSSGGVNQNDSSDYNYDMDDGLPIYSSGKRQQLYKDSNPLENGAPSMTDVLVMSRSEAESSGSYTSRHGDNYETTDEVKNGSDLHSTHHQPIDNSVYYEDASPPKRRRLSSVHQTRQAGNFFQNTATAPQQSSQQFYGAIKDTDKIFGEMIVAEMKTFPENLKFKVKHEINNIIYKYHLQLYEKQDLDTS